MRIARILSTTGATTTAFLDRDRSVYEDDERGWQSASKGARAPEEEGGGRLLGAWARKWACEAQIGSSDAAGCRARVVIAEQVCALMEKEVTTGLFFAT